MSEKFRFNGEIKKEFILGEGKLEMINVVLDRKNIKTPSNRLPTKFNNQLESNESIKPIFDILYVQNNNFIKKNKKNFIKEFTRIADIEYEEIFQDFISGNKNQFDLFKKIRTFISDFKHTNTKQTYFYARKISTDIIDNQNNFVEGQTYFEFKSLWIIEQLFFKQLFEAILIYKQMDEKKISDFLKIKKDKKGFFIETKVYSELKSSAKYKDAFLELEFIEKMQKGLTDVSFIKDDRKFLKPQDFVYYFPNDNNENIKIEDKTNFKNLEDFIYNKINFLISLSIKVQLSTESNSFIASQETVGFGIRGILTYLIMNLLKTAKGSLKCKFDECENILSFKLGSGKKGKLFCSDKCKNQYFYKKKLETNYTFDDFNFYGFGNIVRELKPFDAVISCSLENKKNKLIIFAEYTKINEFNYDRHFLKDAKSISLINKINKKLIDSYLNIIEDSKSKNIEHKIYFLDIISDNKDGINSRTYKYHFQIKDNKWGFFKTQQLLNKSQMLDKNLNKFVKIEKFDLVKIDKFNRKIKKGWLESKKIN